MKKYTPRQLPGICTLMPNPNYYYMQHALTLAALRLAGPELTKLHAKAPALRAESLQKEHAALAARAQAVMPSIQHAGFGGGGLRGFAHVGVWRTLLALAEMDGVGMAKQLRTVSGCSAGSLAAVAIAMGVEPGVMADWVLSLKHTELTHVVWASSTETSILSTEMLRQITERMIRVALLSPECKAAFLAVHGAERWEAAVKNTASLTFSELHAVHGIELRIYLSNMTDKRLEVWSHASHPEESVQWAVCASASAPGIFPPVVRRSTGDLYWDGGVYQHSPRLPFPDVDPSTVLLVHLKMPETQYRDLVDLLARCSTDACVAARTSSIARWRALTSVLVNAIVEGQHEAHDGVPPPKCAAHTVVVASDCSILNMVKGITLLTRAAILHQGDNAAREWLLAHKG